MRYQSHSVQRIRPVCPTNFTLTLPLIPLVTLPTIPVGAFDLHPATVQVQFQLQPRSDAQASNRLQRPPAINISADVIEALANLMLEYPKETALAVGLVAIIALACWIGSQN